MKNYIKRKLIGSAQSLAILLWLPSILLTNSCNVGKIGLEPQKSAAKSDKQEIKDDSASPSEIILFCGNPGVGKSSLCNSIFQKAIFQSGANSGGGLTKEKQEHIYENRKYIDTPGLSDTELREQAAKEIEKSLKENNNYKILFVATLESGRIRPDDLVTINSVCDAIQTNFEYGIIFNKLTKGAIREIGENGENLRGSLDMLHKQPSSAIVIKRDTDMEDERNQYLPVDSEDRKKLIKFIDNLEANRILDNNVNNIDVRAYEEKIKAMELELKEALKAAAEERKVQAELQAKLQAELEQLQRDKIAAAEQAERDKKELEIKLEAERKANEERDRKAKAELQEELKKRDDESRKELEKLKAQQAEEGRKAQERFDREKEQQTRLTTENFQKLLQQQQQFQAQQAEEGRKAQERFQQQQAEEGRKTEERFNKQFQQQADQARQAEERLNKQLQQQADQARQERERFQREIDDKNKIIIKKTTPAPILNSPWTSNLNATPAPILNSPWTSNLNATTVPMVKIQKFHGDPKNHYFNVLPRNISCNNAIYDNIQKKYKCRGHNQ